MKANAKQLVKAYISENKTLITGNVAEHLILDTESRDQGFLEFFTDDEIKEYESASAERRAQMQDEVRKFFLDNFNFELTFDVVLNDITSSNSKGFNTSFQICKDYIRNNNGTNNSYFADYKGGTVSVVSRWDDAIVYEEKIN